MGRTIVGSLAAPADDRAIALIGEDHANRAVMTHTGDDYAVATGANNVSAAYAHVTSLVDRAVRLAEATAPIVTMTTVPATATIPTAVTTMITDHDAAAWTADGKFKTDATGIGGWCGGCDAGSGDNEGGECIADKAVHDCSPGVATVAP